MLYLILCLLFRVAISQVVTIVDERCGSPCVDWTKIIDEVARDFPDIEFATVNMRSPEFAPLALLFTDGTKMTVPLPTTLWMDGLEPLVFSREMSSHHFRRWVEDEGRVDLLYTFTSLSDLSEFESNGCFVEHLSRIKPDILNRYMVQLPSVRFMWVPVGEEQVLDISDDNVTIAKCLSDVQMMRNFSFSLLAKRLLPRVVPYNLLTHPLLSEFKWTNELHIVSDEALVYGWDLLSDDYPYTLFVHMSTNDTSEAPGVWYIGNAGSFHFPWTDRRVQNWLSDIETGVYVPRFYDVTSFNLHQWLTDDMDSLLFTYDDGSGCFEMYDSFNVGRMNVSTSDDWKADMVYIYRDNQLFETFDCMSFSLSEVEERMEL